MSTVQEISINVPVLGTSLEDTVNKYRQRSPKTEVGDRHATLILPEYRGIFIGSVLLTISGIATRNTFANNTLGELDAVFAFVVDEDATYQDRLAAVFHPNMRYTRLTQNPNLA